MTEHSYLLSLAGFAPVLPTEPAAVQAAPAHVQRFLDAIADYPAYAIASDWGIAGWNTAYQVLYPNVATVPTAERNLLWLVFTDRDVRALLADWEDTSSRFLAEFRAAAGPRLGDPAYLSLVGRLIEASSEFRQGWENHDVRGFQSRERVFHHPTAGTLHLEHHQMEPSDHPDLHLIIYTPAPHSDADRRLHHLLSTR